MGLGFANSFKINFWKLVSRLKLIGGAFFCLFI